MVGYSRDAGVTFVQTEEMHQRTLESMQLEALNPLRIERVKTSEYKEKRKDYVPSAYIQRRMDEDGTEENRAAQGEGGKRMAAWNTAWTALQDDGTATEDLKDVNEGLGQTHRGKLQADDSVRDYTGEELNFRGGHGGGRGGHYGGRVVVGRGGGFAGRRQGEGRHAATECPAPVKRTRVVKGSSPSHVSSVQSSMKPAMASKIRPATPASPRRSTSTLKQRPAGPTTLLRQATTRSSEVSDSGPSKKAANFDGNLATPDDFMASILQKKGPAATTPDTSEPQVEDNAAPKTVATSNGSDVRSLVGVPDREAIAIANRPNVTKPQFEDDPPKVVAVANLSQTSMPRPGGVTLKAVVSGADNTASVVLPSAPLDLLDVDIEGEGPHQSVVDFTHSADSRPKTGTASLEPSASPPNLNQQMPTPETSLLFENIETLQAFGGLSTEQFELLQTLMLHVQSRASEQAPEASTPNEDSITAIDEPVSQPIKMDTVPTVPQAVVTPSSKADPHECIAQRLVAQRAIIIGEHVHRTRFQHSALVEEFSKLQISEKTSSRLAEAKADGLSTTNPFGPAKPAASQQSGAGPSLPVHLADLSPVTDPGAAVRAQYGPSNASSSDRGATKVRTGPLLPAHLASLPTVTDASAATRASYNSTGVTSRGRGILNSVSNGQLRSFPSSDPATSASSSVPAPRTSMLNKTGFIGLAENRIQAKKSEDSLLMARKRGM